MDLSAIREKPTDRRVAHPEWAIVLGGASEVWYDVASWEGILGRPWDGLILAANDIGCHWPRPLDHWVSCHAEKFDKWLRLRAEAHHPQPYASWGRRLTEPVDYVVHCWAGGSSGMLAVQVALELGCTKIILCGIPMTPTDHFAQSEEFHALSTQWKDSDLHWRGWERVNSYGWFGDAVRSMGGRTQQMFGGPTPEWLETV